MTARVLALAFLCLLILPLSSCDTQPQGDAYDLPAFNVEGLAADDLGDGTVMLNLFASWCGPCLAEHPTLMELSKKIPVYGIAFMDTPGDIEKYLKKHGNPYQKIGHDPDGASAPVFQAPGVPITFVLKDGKVVYRHNGPITFVQKRDILKLIAPE